MKTKMQDSTDRDDQLLLFQTLHLLLKTVQNVLEEDGFLPRKLYLQFDNCVRENKNRFVFGALALLVHWGIFDEVEVGFLLVGHTHDDIDQ
jgi:hypothetical protein